MSFCVLSEDNLVLPNIIQSDQIKRMRRLGHVAHIEENLDGVMMGKCEGKNLFGRLGHRWETNIKMDPDNMGGCGLD